MAEEHQDHAGQVLCSREAEHEDTLRTLGLRKIGQSVVREQTDAVLGAVRTVRHLVTAEEVD